MKTTNRSLRRHHRARILKRRIRNITEGAPNSNQVVQRALRTFNNPKNCSCQWCCNERRNLWLSTSERITFAERRNIDSFNDQLKDIN